MSNGKRNLSVKFSAWMLYFWWKCSIYFYPILFYFFLLECCTFDESGPYTFILFHPTQIRWDDAETTFPIKSIPIVPYLGEAAQKREKCGLLQNLPHTLYHFAPCHLGSSQSAKFWYLERLWNLESGSGSTDFGAGWDPKLKSVAILILRYNFPFFNIQLDGSGKRRRINLK